MEMNDIRYFVAMAQKLNFTKAAEVCQVTQPALTRAIRKMEDELGGLLFSREPNNTHLTELGRLIQPHLTEILKQTGEVKETATRFLNLDDANLKLGTMCTISPVPFVNFLDHFRADNPGIEVTLLEGMPGELCDLLAKGELDVALMAHPDGFSAPLRASKLYSERFVVACSAGHRFATENEIRMSDLDGEFYLSRINCEFYHVLDDLCRTHGAKLVKSYQSEREDWILTMVAAGMGVCFLPEYTATFPGVVSCPVVSPAVARDVCLVSVAGRRWSPPVAAFVHAIKGHSWSQWNEARHGGSPGVRAGGMASAMPEKLSA
jgi:DNA-binding transcriptional LysR family regulator